MNVSLTIISGPFTEAASGFQRLPSHSIPCTFRWLVYNTIAFDDHSYESFFCNNWQNMCTHIIQAVLLKNGSLYNFGTIPSDEIITNICLFGIVHAHLVPRQFLKWSKYILRALCAHMCTYTCAHMYILPLECSLWSCPLQK